MKAMMARLRYAFDNTMSRGTLALIGWLALLSALLVVLAAAIISIAGIRPGDADRVGFIEAAWLSLMRTLDPGTMGGDTGWWFRVVMLLVTLGGIFVISTLIGLVTSGIGTQLEELRKGRSHVIESGHTVILGWSELIFDIATELAIANADHPGSVAVILADRDKVAMLDELRRKVGSTHPMRVVCRTGAPSVPADVEMVSVDTSRSIVVLAPDGDPDPDAAIIKSVLAILNRPHRRRDPYHIVVELQDEKNREVLQTVARDEIEIVVVPDLIARITAQTARQPGLSVVYMDLLDFAGDEIYFHGEPQLVGRTFREALDAYEDVTVIGLRPASSAPMVNPPLDRLIQAGDELIVIARDDSAIVLSRRERPAVDAARIVQNLATRPPMPERTLFLGWNRHAGAVLRQLDGYVPAGSSARVIGPFDRFEALTARFGNLTNLTVAFDTGDITDRATLDALDIARFDHVIVLASDAVDPQQADARTIVILLHLRDIAERHGAGFSIVTEMLDVRNRELVEGRRVEDFIVSKRLVGLILSQITEHKALSSVFADLFDPEGAEIYLKPVAEYVTTGPPVDFHTLLDAAAQRGEVAIGYRHVRPAEGARAHFGVVMNPRKSEPIEFAEGDQLIVIAEA